MRISTAYQYDSYSRSVSRAQERVTDAESRLASGNRIAKPEDDPFGTTQVLSMRSMKASLAQYRSNLTTAKGYLGFTEQALSDGSDIMTRAYQLAVSGANSPTDQQGRNGMAQEITALQQRLVDTANTQGPNGAYIFAGQKTNAAPFTPSSGALTYNGDSNNIIVETSPSSTMVVNTQGNSLFTNAYTQLETLKNDLLSGSTSNISNDIASLQSSRDAITLERGNVGVKLQQVQTFDDQHARRTDDLTSQISDLQEVDYAQAITDYRSADTAYQAALTVASQGFRLSLMDFIKG